MGMTNIFEVFPTACLLVVNLKLLNKAIGARLTSFISLVFSVCISRIIIFFDNFKTQIKITI